MSDINNLLEKRRQALQVEFSVNPATLLALGNTIVLDDKIIAELQWENSRLQQENSKLRQRLQISPYGDDKIDELETAIDFLRHDIAVKDQHIAELSTVPDVTSFKRVIEYVESEAKICKEIMDNDPEPEDAYAYFNIYTDIAAIIRSQQARIADMESRIAKIVNAYSGQSDSSC